jgi:hypothetical protein
MFRSKASKYPIITRVAKLRKLPFNNVVKEWFLNHKDIHGLTENEIEKVSKIILDGKHFARFKNERGIGIHQTKKSVQVK